MTVQVINTGTFPNDTTGDPLQTAFLKINANFTAGAANTIYTPPFTGGVATTVGAKLAQTVSVLDFGADPTGVIDATAAILNAVATAGAGGYVLFPPGTFKISSTIVIGNGTTTVPSSINGITLQASGPDPIFSSIQTGTRLLWAGSAGGTMLQFKGAGAGGGILGGITLDGGGTAACGLDLLHWCSAQFPALDIRRCTGTYFKLRTQTVPDVTGGCRDNTIGIYTTDTVPTGAIGLSLDALATTTSTEGNNFLVIDMPMSGTGATGMFLGFADFNLFHNVDLSCQTTLTTSVGIQLQGSGFSGSFVFPSMNQWSLLATTAPIVTNTAGGQPFGNYIALFDLADSSQVIPTAAGVYGYSVVTNNSGTQRMTQPFGYKGQGWNPGQPTVASMAFSGTASCVGTLMTVTGSSGALLVGSVFTGTGVAAGTFVVSFGTGTGGNGTYTISQTFAGSPTITASSGQNTLSYPVNAYMAQAVAGGLNGIYLGDSHGSVNPVFGTQALVRIDPGCTISFTATALTGWIWYGLSA